jgi:hypothetical protein
MSMTDFEIRSLQEIAAAVRRSDPRLARSLSTGRFHARRADIVTVVIGVIAIAALVVGIAFHLRLVCAVCWPLIIISTLVRAVSRECEH